MGESSEREQEKGWIRDGCKSKKHKRKNECKAGSTERKKEAMLCLSRIRSKAAEISEISNC